MTADTRNWTETKRRLQLRWPGLPEEDLDASNGERSALLALLQGRLGYARSNAEQDLDEVLAGETIVPRDIADAESHTGTSASVGPASSATGFTGGAPDRAPNGERAEPPNQPREDTAASSPASPTEALAGGTVPEGVRGSGDPPIGGGGHWGQDPWDRMHGDGRDMGGLGMRKAVIGIAVGAGILLAVGLLAGRRRKRKRGKADQVTEQARHLLEEISDRMPSVEEIRDKIRSLDELREKKMAAARH